MPPAADPCFSGIQPAALWPSARPPPRRRSMPVNTGPEEIPTKTLGSPYRAVNFRMDEDGNLFCQNNKNSFFGKGNLCKISVLTKFKLGIDFL